jgi:hypothetical protein
MPINRLFALIFLAAIFFGSCKKKETNSTSTITAADKAQLNSLFAPLRTTPQHFTVTAGVDNKIIGADSTILNFYPNSFKDKNGNIITSGSIDIELVEMYKAGDMIANRASTTTSSGVLTSGGQVHIGASMNGDEVFANVYGIGFKQTAVLTKPMELYYGNTTNADSMVIWRVTEPMNLGSTLTGTSNFLRGQVNPSGSPYFLFDSCVNFKYVNCDHHYDSTSKLVTININVPDNSFTPANISLSISYPSLNIVTLLGAMSYNSKSVQFSGWAPVGPGCKFVLMTIKGTDYYYFSTSGVVTDGMTINADMKVETVDMIKADLKSL